MTREKIYYICKECDYKTPKWMGRCSNCGAWNSFEELPETDLDSQNNFPATTPCPISAVESGERQRYRIGIKEMDRVLGGGIVAGSLVLIGGAPGIGKSTLILQVASLFSNKYGKVLYVSGEESARQIKLRAERLNALAEQLYVLAETEFNRLHGIFQEEEEFKLIVIDSIQTIYDARYDSAPGSISQVKEVTLQLMELAKRMEIPIILIGHVTKEGELAGPRVLEHLVDAVLQFEGDRNYAYRILRAVKNRFGSTNEVGVFEMKSSGMEEVSNPSQLFLEERPEGVSGSVIVPVIEGSRPILVEVQSLVSTAAFGNPQRITTGVDFKRVSLLLAVLEKKAGYAIQTQDVHLNITGGLRVDEPALDLGMVMAIVSSYKDYALPAELAVVGEVGLAGEVRAVSQVEQRIKELKKMGFKQLFIPQGNVKGLDFDPEVNIAGVKNIHEIIRMIFG